MNFVALERIFDEMTCNVLRCCNFVIDLLIYLDAGQFLIFKCVYRVRYTADGISPSCPDYRRPFLLPSISHLTPFSLLSFITRVDSLVVISILTSLLSTRSDGWRYLSKYILLIVLEGTGLAFITERKYSQCFGKVIFWHSLLMW